MSGFKSQLGDYWNSILNISSDLKQLVWRPPPPVQQEIVKIIQETKVVMFKEGAIFVRLAGLSGVLAVALAAYGTHGTYLQILTYRICLEIVVFLFDFWLFKYNFVSDNNELERMYISDKLITGRFCKIIVLSCTLYFIQILNVVVFKYMEADKELKEVCIRRRYLRLLCFFALFRIPLFYCD